jgi:hypothetical protein
LWCAEDLIWAHPKARGGWRKHAADLTYVRHKGSPDAALEAAENTYRFIVEFLAKNPRFASRKPLSWGILVKDVSEFIAADTAPQKLEWFKAQDNVVPWTDWETFPCFLRTIHLVFHRVMPCGGDVAFYSQGQAYKVSQTVAPPPIPVREDIKEFAEQLFSTWLLDRNFERAVNNFVDIDAVTGALLADMEMHVDVERERWIQTLFAMWLLEDHGLVERFGHGMPDAEGYGSLSEAVREGKLMKFDHVEEAIRARGTGQPFLVVPPEEMGEVNGRFGILFGFHHAPRDALLFVLDKSGVFSDWKIVFTGSCSRTAYK